LALQCLAHLFECLEVDAQGLALFQAPKRSVAYTGLLSQPVEGFPMLGQQLIYSDVDHKYFHCAAQYLPHAVNIVYLQYILYLTYTEHCRKVAVVINLYINERQSAAVTILDLKGRLRVGGNAVALHRSIRSLLLEKKTQIVLNLAGVTFIDSCGLGELVASQVSVENKGGEIKLIGLTESLRELFIVTRLLAVFAIYETEADAVQGFTERIASAEKTPLAFA
jgi:anti-sigma B factor antagonist